MSLQVPTSTSKVNKAPYSKSLTSEVCHLRSADYNLDHFT